MNINNDAQVVFLFTDSEIVNIVMNTNKNKSDKSDNGGNEIKEEKVSIDRCISLKWNKIFFFSEKI